MRNVIVSSLVSLDGVQGDPRSWAGPYFGAEATASAIARLRQTDAMLMGRGSYEYFAPAWAGAEGPYMEALGAVTKYVLSSTLREADWSNATVVAEDAVRFVTDLKRGGDGDLVIYGYTRLARTLLTHDLVDVLELAVHPVVLGGGEPVLRSGATKPLRLAGVDRREHGVVSLRYERA